MVLNIDAQNKASRLKAARALAGLSRRQIEEVYGISVNTQRMWEDPREGKGGLTEKGAIRIVEALKMNDVICSLEWLLYGIGQGPRNYTDVADNVVKPLQSFINIPEIDWGRDEIIFEEVNFFIQVNPQPITLRMADDSMEPILSMMDFVAGNKCYDNFSHLLGEICIVETKSNLTLCRRLDRSKNENLYNLSSINPKTSAEVPILYDEALHSAAKVIWIRKH